MTTTQTGTVLRRLCDLVAAEADGRLSDHQLLERFAQRHEAAAFEALLRRHGPLVWGVCRRVLGNWHDAEDAFQAAFLALAQRAGSVGKSGSVGGWLHRVAYHAALKARAQEARRQRHERRASSPDLRDPLDDVTAREFLAVLDEEMQRLAERHRTPLVLCYLEGRTCDQAARQLGWSLRTLKRRLEQARTCLRERLGRRGLTLPAALLASGVAGEALALPAALATATVRTVTAAAVGVASARVAALAEAAVKPLGSSIKLCAAMTLALAASLLVMVAGPFAGAKPAAPPPEQSQPILPPAQADLEDPKAMPVTGRVLTPDGKPAAQARVAVLARQGVLLCSWEGWADYRNEIVARAQTDAEGRFRLRVPRLDKDLTLRQLRVVATAPGHGLAWKALDPNADQTATELRLVAEQPVRGRLGGIQGEPAAGVTVHVTRVSRKPNKGEREADASVRLTTGLGLTATTDANGDFTLNGLGPNMTLELAIRDPRYERKEEWQVNTADKKQGENLRLVLAPGRYVEGRVVYQDTGKPAPQARMMIANPIVETEADADGRFKVALCAPRDGDPFTSYPREIRIRAYPPAGAPYLSGYADAGYPKGVVRREVVVALPRAVLVHGKITEAATGAPVAGAYLEHQWPLLEGRAVSGPDGTYRFGVPAGTVRLTVTHPSGDFIPIVLGTADGPLDKPSGDPMYYHAAAELDVKAGAADKEVNFTLRRGVPLKGRLLGPDGKPVRHAVYFLSGHRAPEEKTMHPIKVHDGTFEVRGLDPEKTCRLVFLEHSRPLRILMGVEAEKTFGQYMLPQLLGAENKLGAAVELSAKRPGGTPVEVRLAPCGTARVRLRDAAGKPLVKYKPWLQLVVTPGPPANQAIAEGKLAAEVITLINKYGEPAEPCTNAEGYITLQGLIPGATYRIKKSTTTGEVVREFTVEAGQTRELEAVVE
jgi:RNA polymerase sigma factor (sigma-70 family)